MPNIPLNCIQPDPRSANTWDQETLEKIIRNIERTGLYPPLIVRNDPNNPKRKFLVDGHLRKTALEKLGH